MMKILVAVIGLLFLVPDTMQLSIEHPLHTVVERLNVNVGPFLGLVITSDRDEKTLLDSSYFEPDTSFPYVTIAGRRFNFGKFNSEPVIYVLGGEPLNLGRQSFGDSMLPPDPQTLKFGYYIVQILLDTFRIKGIINYGSAATVSNQVFIADVVVPSQVAFTGVWKWEKYGAEGVEGPALEIGEYNVPKAGENYLESIAFQQTKLFTPTSSKKSTYWFNVHSDWVQLASELNFGERPTVHIGSSVKVGSSDIYLNNVAYGTFLNKHLNVTAIDTQSAAVVATSIANGVPHIVFRGTSNRPGTVSDSKLSETTAKNVLKTVAVFISNLSPKSYANVY